ncbi:MAG: polyisoprenoid-binding protein [Chitinophagaceae bacterium]|nr:MAG: polyisoprenoid-binding protein [Chitinophagaceae bacterium]
MDSTNNLSTPQPTGNAVIWAIDPVHSRIRFDARYLLLSAVSGWFNDFEGTVVAGPDNFNDSRIRLAIYTSSVNTGNEERDKHLRSADFFDAIHHPVIGFHSTSVVQSGPELQVTGLISIRDIQREQYFTATWLGTLPDPMGNQKAGFTLDLVLNRKDFNISWNQAFDRSGILLSDEIHLHADLQLLRLSSNPA